jgi:hypothetical protein
VALEDEDAVPQDDLNAGVQQVSQRHGVDPSLLHAVIAQESGGNPRAVSPQGAAGLMQLEPKTAASLGVTNLFDWRQSLDAGARYLRQGLEKYGGDRQLAAAYYHGGPDEEQWGPRTAQYADAVSARAGAKQQPPPGPLALGDSLATGLGGQGRQGASPQAVFNDVYNTPAETVRGRDVVLSSGASNDPRQLQWVQAQVTNLQAKGARSVALVGVGDRQDIAGANAGLSDIARQSGARFVPLSSALLGPDRVHPTQQGYQALLTQATQPQQSIGDQISAARKAGYADGEIAAFLKQSQTWGPKFAAAAKAGYGEADVLQHLGLKPEPEVQLSRRARIAQMPMAQADVPATPEEQAKHEYALTGMGRTDEQGNLLGDQGETAPALQRIGEAIRSGYASAPPLVEPNSDAGRWLSSHGFMGVTGEGLTKPFIPFAVVNAIWQGGTEAAYQTAKGLGMPETLARDVAGYVESLGMTGAPHVPLAEPLRMAGEARQAARAPGVMSAAGEAAMTPGTPAPLATLGRAAEGQAAPEAMPMLARMASDARQREAEVAAAKPLEPAQPSASRETLATERETPATEPEARALPKAVGVAALPDITVTAKRPIAEESAAEQQPPPERIEPPLPTSEETAPALIPEERAAPKRATAYAPLPREPQRLVDFLKSKTVLAPNTIHEQTIPGGIKDPRGDVSSIIGGTKGRPGLINNRTGWTLDDAARRAWEAGYFGYREDRPDINELLDAIENDHRGLAQYSAHDIEAVEAYHDALAANIETDRLAEQYQTPTRGLTREQFFDRLHDSMSVEERAREIAEQDASAGAAYRDMEKGIRVLPPEAGIAPSPWDARDFYGQSQFRSLDDLEREYRQQETAAASAQQLPGRAGETGSARRTEGVGEEGVGPRERGIGPTGRPEAEGPPADILGHPLTEPARRVQPAPTIRTDERQVGIPGTGPSAVQAQAARDAGRGTLRREGPQKAADEGLFAPDTSGQGTLYSFPGALLDPEAWRRAFGPLAPAAAALKQWTEKAAHARDELFFPMRMGSKTAQSTAADFANALRGVQHRYGQVDREIERHFKPAERDAMGRALDAQSVFEQQARDLPPEEQARARADFDAGRTGVVGLPERQRQAVEALNVISQDVWRRMQERGMVAPGARGLPYYMPRQILLWSEAEGFRRPGGGGGAGRALEPIGTNLTTQGPMRREHLTPEETEAAARGALGPEATLLRDIRSLPSRLAYAERAIAGTDLLQRIEQVGRETGVDLVVRGDIPGMLHPGDYFTIADHPSFRRWTGNGWQAIHVAKDFEGPLKAVLAKPGPALYRAAMALKSGVMSSIMFSPFIHLGVEIGRALPTMPLRVLTLRVFRDGSVLRRDLDYMDQATKDGLSPLGGRGWRTDPVSIAEQSIGAQSANRFVRAVQAARDAVANGAGRIGGEFLHDVVQHPHATLLWDQVFGLQVGIYDAMRARYIAKGYQPEVAGTMAAHLANRYAGALPPEHLSRWANMTANLLAFSRSFTLGNLGVMKDAFTGAPSHVLARIEQMAGPDVARSAQKTLRNKAIAAVALDMGLFYAANGLLQVGLGALRGEPAVDEWLDDARNAADAAKDNPLSIFGVLPQHWNEPGKQDRVYAGTDSEGRGVYLRLPPGKVGEEFIGWFAKPGTMLEAKASPLVRPIIEAIFGRDTLGRPLYKPNPQTLGDHLSIAGAVVRHFVEGLGPTAAIQGVSELVQRHVLGKESAPSDPWVSWMKVLGPMTGLAQVSRGFPGGPAAGEMHAQGEREKYDLQQALPAIREKIKAGDTEGAVRDMQVLNVPPGLMRYYVRQTLTPGPTKGMYKRLQGAPADVRQRVERDLMRQP